MSPSVRHPIAVTFALLVVLLGISVFVADVERWTPGIVLALAAAKVALVVSEFVEVRGAASWLVGAWLAWGVAVFGGLAVLLLS
jgi:hypothetical protein